MRDTLQKHHDHRQRDATDSLLDTPAVDEHAGWDNAPQEPQTAAEPVLCFAVPSYTDILFGNVVCVSPTEESTEEIAAAWGDVKERPLERRGEIKARIENIADWCKEGVHVPDQ